MKFEIEGQPLVQETIVKARLEIDRSGDLLLIINDILIAYICSKSGELVAAYQDELTIKKLRGIGICMMEEGKISSVP